MPTLTSPTPEHFRDRKWKKFADGAEWRIDNNTVTFNAAPKSGYQSFTVHIGDGPGQAAAIALVRGRLGYKNKPLIVDHWVLVDVEGIPVSPALRRTYPGLDEPRAAWWPLAEVRDFMKVAGLPVRYETAHSLQDLESRFPVVIETDPLVTGGRKLFGF